MTHSNDDQDTHNAKMASKLAYAFGETVSVESPAGVQQPGVVVGTERLIEGFPRALPIYHIRMLAGPLNGRTIGAINLPIIRFSVEWWNSLHQGETINLTSGESQMHASMLWPLIFTTFATKFWFVASLLQRARVLNLENESAQPWAKALATESR
jgi:hypothetical protein